MNHLVRDTVLFILGVVLIVMTTVTCMNKKWERDAIQQGNGYYHPQTGNFTWDSEG